ncbi:class I SAM-dependent DNA methyltransferase [Planktotalea frisia]|uniref:class I SAM-dependent DNA methyltransferase n=1 Tax=Planktotalea frisia TaxID=696762 RepID=UPI002354642A|nr:methyltransferase domain-containing protein [Planktotalea frisia]
MADTFLDKAYDTVGTEATRALYADWAKSYDKEISENGYATPGRCADALKSVTRDFTKPILDFGCGTGLSGLALSLAGFKTIDGVDLTQEMLDRAKEKQLYRSLKLSEPDKGLTINSGEYVAVAAIGVIGAGAAPIDVFDMIINALPSEAHFVFSFNDHTLKDPSFEANVNAAIAANKAKILVENYGDHLRGLNMKSKVYVLEKT